MFQVGDYIMYKNIGVCTVEAVGKLSFSAGKEKDYYTLRPLYASNNTHIYVPVDSNLFMRNVITKQEAYYYLMELENMESKPFGAKKTAQLNAHYDGLLATHKITDRLRLLKELYQKEEKVKEKGKKFGQMETNYKNKIEKLLADEFSYALNETPELSKKRLYRALSKI